MAKAMTKTRDVAGLKVMVCVDDSHNAELAFQYYAEHVHRPENDVIIAHVSDISYPTSHLYSGAVGIAMPTPAGMSPDVAQEKLEKERKKNREIEKKYRAKCESFNMKHDFVALLESGHGLGASIVEAAHKHEMNFIVVGSRGRGAIRRTILGSVSDYVLHHSHVPTLICPKQGLNEEYHGHR